MKKVKCPKCNYEHKIKDNIVISLCPACLEIMEEIKNEKIDLYKK